jgi:hypothetical protein
MKYKVLFFVISALLLVNLHGYTQTNKVYKVNPGEKVTQVIPANDIYEYPEFQEATVQFKIAKAGMGKMNYNRLLKEIEFIDANLDTNALADANTMHYIVMAKDTFYYDKYYVKQVSNKNNVKLAESRVLLLSNRQKIGGFGEVNGGSVESKEQLSSNANMLKDLVAKEILTFSESKTWYFGDRFNHFKQASKKNLLDMFSKYKPDLQKFLDENVFNYFAEADIKKIAAFLQE